MAFSDKGIITTIRTGLEGLSSPAWTVRLTLIEIPKVPDRTICVVPVSRGRRDVDRTHAERVLRLLIGLRSKLVSDTESQDPFDQLLDDIASIETCILGLSALPGQTTIEDWQFVYEGQTQPGRAIGAIAQLVVPYRTTK